MGLPGVADAGGEHFHIAGGRGIGAEAGCLREAESGGNARGHGLELVEERAEHGLSAVDDDIEAGKIAACRNRNDAIP